LPLARTTAARTMAPTGAAVFELPPATKRQAAD
jgi:hypothetical protein